MLGINHRMILPLALQFGCTKNWTRAHAHLCFLLMQDPEHSSSYGHRTYSPSNHFVSVPSSHAGMDYEGKISRGYGGYLHATFISLNSTAMEI
jgi:hypothetical protein